MSKPICLIKIDVGAVISSTGNNITLNDCQKRFEEKWADYHVLVIPSYDAPQVVELEVFYEKDFTEIQYEELKKYIEQRILPPNLPVPAAAHFA